MVPGALALIPMLEIYFTNFFPKLWRIHKLQQSILIILSLHSLKKKKKKKETVIFNFHNKNININYMLIKMKKK